MRRCFCPRDRLDHRDKAQAHIQAPEVGYLLTAAFPKQSVFA
jgi:hypothetical protein